MGGGSAMTQSTLTNQRSLRHADAELGRCHAVVTRPHSRTPAAFLSANESVSPSFGVGEEGRLRIRPQTDTRQQRG